MLKSLMRQQFWTVIWIISILFVLNTLVLAQEVTEEPSPTATLEPTFTPTLTPVPPTATPLPTSTPLPTLTPTLETTEEATVEVTEEPTAEVTEEATSEVTPEVTVEVTEEATLEVTEEPTAEVTEEATQQAPIPPLASALAPPLLKSPSDGSSTNSVRPKLSWFKVTGSKGYRVDLADNDTFLDPLLEDYATSMTSLALNSKVLAQELRPGTYYWRIQVVDNLGDWSTESQIFEFSVGLQRTPKYNTFTTNSRIPLVWARAQDAIGYRLIVSDTSDFSNTPIVDETYDTNRTIRYNPPKENPLPIANLWWRVDVQYPDPEGWVESPVVFALTITPKPLDRPNILTPENRSYTNDTQPEFSWSEVIDPGAQPVTYWLQIATSANFRTVIFETQQSATTYTGFTLPADGRYYVRVAALNYLGAPSKWSRTAFFTLDTVDPDAPILTNPKDGSSTNKSTYSFNWKSVRGAVSYELRLGTANPPDGGLTFDVGKKTSFKYKTPLLTTTYYWQVRAYDAAGNVSAWSTAFSFNVESPSNAVPVLNRFATTTPTLTWTPISWSQGYEVQVAADNNFNTIVYSTNTIPSNTLTHTLATALPEGVYYWRVRARSGADTWGTWSTTGVFLVQVS